MPRLICIAHGVHKVPAWARDTMCCFVSILTGYVTSAFCMLMIRLLSWPGLAFSSLLLHVLDPSTILRSIPFLEKADVFTMSANVDATSSSKPCMCAPSLLFVSRIWRRI